MKLLASGPKSIQYALGLITSLLLGAMWLFTSKWGWIKPLYLPPPWRVAEAATEIEPNLLVHSFFTTGLVVCGVFVGTVVGFLVGFFLRHSFIARAMISPLIDSSRPVPAVALVPFFILWFGFSWVGKLILVSLGTFLVVVVRVTEAIDHLDPIYLRIALSFGGNNWKFLRYAALPAIIPVMLGPLRIALAVAVTLAVVSEYMGSTRGLGYVINIALNTFSSHTILLCALLLGVIGGFWDWVLRKIHRRLVTWSKTVGDAIQIKTY
jgi:ABC-type nitrate/sulfonate/bicarbonate transport system permease component